MNTATDTQRTLGVGMGARMGLAGMAAGVVDVEEEMTAAMTTAGWG